MDKNKIHGFMDHLNLFFDGANYLEAKSKVDELIAK